MCIASVQHFTTCATTHEKENKVYQIKITNQVIQCCLEIVTPTALGAGHISQEMLCFILTATIEAESTK